MILAFTGVEYEKPNTEVAEFRDHLSQDRFSGGDLILALRNIDRRADTQLGQLTEQRPTPAVALGREVNTPLPSCGEAAHRPASLGQFGR